MIDKIKLGIAYALVALGLVYVACLAAAAPVLLATWAAAKYLPMAFAAP